MSLFHQNIWKIWLINSGNISNPCKCSKIDVDEFLQNLLLRLKLGEIALNVDPKKCRSYENSQFLESSRDYLVDLEKCLKISIWFQKSASILPRIGTGNVQQPIPFNRPRWSKHWSLITAYEQRRMSFQGGFRSLTSKCAKLPIHLLSVKSFSKVGPWRASSPLASRPSLAEAASAWLREPASGEATRSPALSAYSWGTTEASK